MQPLRLDRSVIRVSGADALAFLNNLLTQDIEPIAPDAPRYGALLSPQGKVIADMIIWQDAGASVFLLDVARERAADLVRRLTMFKLRADVLIDDCANSSGVAFSPEPWASAVADPRAPDGRLGYRRIMPKAEAEALAAGEEAWRTLRIAQAVPDLSVDAQPEEVFALEGLLEELHGVDFQKGCFVGQENVSRMKRRATTRRKFCPLQFEGEAAFGTPILAGEAELGSVRSGQGSRALALLRLDRALEAEAKGLTLTAGGVSARLNPPSWLILPAADA